MKPAKTVFQTTMGLFLCLTLALPSSSFALRIEQTGDSTALLNGLELRLKQDNPLPAAGLEEKWSSFPWESLEGKTLRQKLLRLRRFVDLTQRRFAEESGISMYYYFALEKGTKVPSLRLRRKIADFYVERQGAPRWKIYRVFEIRDPSEILKGLKGKPVHEVIRGLRESVGVFKEGDTGIAKILGMDRREYRILERGQIVPTMKQLRKLITYYSEEHDFPPDALARVLGIKSAEEILDGVEGEELPKIIRTLRNFAGLTQGEMAEAIKVSEATYRVWEWDGARAPSLANRRTLAGYYETAHGFPSVRIRRIFRVEIPAAEVMTQLAEVASFSDALRLLRTSQGLLPAQLAEILGVSRNSYYSWEENRVVPGLGDQEKIAVYFSEKWGFPYRQLLSHLTGLAHAQQPIPLAVLDVPMLNITVNDQRFRVPAAGLIGSQLLNFKQLFNLLVREKLIDYQDSREIESRRVIIERETETDQGTKPVAKVLGSPVTTEELNRLHAFSMVKDNDQIVISPILIRKWKPRQIEDVGRFLNPTRVVRHPDGVDIWLLSEETEAGTEEEGIQPPPDAGLEEQGKRLMEAYPDLDLEAASSAVEKNWTVERLQEIEEINRRFSSFFSERYGFTAWARLFFGRNPGGEAFVTYGSAEGPVIGIDPEQVYWAQAKAYINRWYLEERAHALQMDRIGEPVGVKSLFSSSDYKKLFQSIRSGVDAADVRFRIPPFPLERFLAIPIEQEDRVDSLDIRVAMGALEAHAAAWAWMFSLDWLPAEPIDPAQRSRMFWEASIRQEEGTLRGLQMRGVLQAEPYGVAYLAESAAVLEGMLQVNAESRFLSVELEERARQLAADYASAVEGGAFYQADLFEPLKEAYRSHFLAAVDLFQDRIVRLPDAGLEEQTRKDVIDILEEAMPGGPGILVIEAGVVSRRMGLAEFIARVPRKMGNRIVLFGPESAEAREIAVRNGITVVDSDKLNDLILQLMILGDEADRVGYLGDPETAAVLSARLPSSMKVTLFDPETALDRILLYLGFPQSVLETINAVGIEELFAQARAA